MEVEPSPKSHFQVIGVDPIEVSVKSTRVGMVVNAYLASNWATGARPTVIYPVCVLSAADAPGLPRARNRMINPARTQAILDLIAITP